MSAPNAEPHPASQSSGLHRYALQSLLAAVCIIGIMLVLDLLLQTAIVTTLGATTFIVFAMPNARTAHPRRLLGGYLVGMITGVLCWQLAAWGLRFWPSLPPHTLTIIMAGVAVGLATYLMSRTHSEHPPAAGLALGLVLDEWSLATLAFVAGAVVLLSGMSVLLKRLLDDLV